MAANEFEKNVRTEMDEFKLRPSEEVWTKIEEKITENKRKRRILFFILSSLIAVMLGGYGMYQLTSGKIRSEATDEFSQGSRANDRNKIDSSNNKELDREPIAINPNTAVENIKQTQSPVGVANKERHFKTQKDKLQPSISKKDRILKDQTTINEDKSKQNKESGSKDDADQGRAVSSLNQQHIEADRKDETSNVNHEKSNPTNTPLQLRETKDTTSVEVVNKKRNDVVSHKITWGINFSAGRSVITEEAFSFKSSYAAADRQSNTPGSVTGGGGSGNPGASTYSQSQNESAFAFKAGIHARKNISKRSSLSLGLGYAYLADKIRIGTNQAYSQSSAALYYYSGSPGQTHTDHFHFIELPLTYNWRVTNNADHFLSLNAGVAPSYLLSTNALLYDTTMGGIYYHNKDLITKTHFSFMSGVSYQFRNKNLEFSLGPQFSFDVTNVFKSDLDKRKYFFYSGIDARVFFDKKEK